MSEAGGKDDQHAPAPRKTRAKRKFSSKAKTGCLTCRIRRIKCDEGRPACERCVSTGRVCDGYPSPIRIVNVGPTPPSSARHVAQPSPSLSLYRPRASIVTADEVNRVAYLFPLKHNGVNVGYQQEARATLAKLSEPAIHHALSSLAALHDALAVDRKACSNPRAVLLSTHRGLDAYNTAVASLASQIGREAGQSSAHAALLCCQLFISIETILGDYSSGIRHFIRGLRIMYQYRSRPAANEDGEILPCCRPRLPCLDSFLIKLFATGNPLAGQQMQRPVATERGHKTSTSKLPWGMQARCELAVFSMQTLAFLDKISSLQAHHEIAGLRIWKDQLLHLLLSWERNYSTALQELISSNASMPMRFGTAFSMFLHLVLKAVVSLAMTSSITEVEALEDNFRNLTQIAHLLTDMRKPGTEQTPNGSVAVVADLSHATTRRLQP